METDSDDEYRPNSPLEWSTEKRKIADLVGFENNPRKMSNKDRAELQRSLEKFNLAEIPAIDADNTILAGNQRVGVLVELGRAEEEIDVRVPNRALTEAEREEYLLRSNKNVGEWDETLLIQHFDENVMLDAGFTSAEIRSFQTEEEEEKQADEFEVPDMELRAFEHHDYIVIAFARTEDWIRAQELLGVDRVNYSWAETKTKIGLGRVVNAERFFEVLDTEPGAPQDDHGAQTVSVGDSDSAGKRKKPVRNKAKAAG